MILHEDEKIFQDAIVATAQHFGIPEVYIEKDYWVSLVLKELFASEISDQVVFKGGTSLSKCHHLIERFSEDVDLVVFRVGNEADNQLKKKLKIIGKVVNKIIPEIDVPGYTNKRGMIRKTVHQYQKAFNGDLGQVGESIVVEASWLGNSEPFSKKSVTCYIQEFIEKNGPHELLEKYELAAFDVQALSVRRTFCEKIMSLVRFSLTGDPNEELPNKVRHIYDLHLMMQDEHILSFFRSDEFIKMLLKVGHDDFVGYRNNNDWLKQHPCSAVIFSDPEKVWDSIQSAYTSSFKRMVYGKLPDEAALLETLAQINGRIRAIDWNIGE
ncbi:MAG: nucleotidyl transferase AbiEii/AbiGii toxin family protein [Desulfovibrionales bacterium]|nr:nucleotidyl transferase AbiEii/AbiGii toxin family protein [Desulfovibrionales bacterium]